MRVKLFLLSMVAVGMMAASAFAASPDWFKLDENEDSSFFFDRSGVTPLREGVIQVRTRVVYSDQGRKDALKVLAELPDSTPLYETLYSYEINCAEREGHLLAATHLDKKGGTLRSTDLSAVTEWEEFPPDTRMGLVIVQACTR
ncbi:hypothetical protein E4633_20005 [Geomonas terrae]|uniref:Uncharacterized protein n=1 Tax=Geomonas terrae TaxID=2562681 RepID=A0A4S1C9Y1_9BACT|nr:surface-adhesin E family protein [Geomonas terrae]TGU70088.1 hypothetical protein E4633_20005 [Geomonas terrae]